MLDTQYFIRYLHRQCAAFIAAHVNAAFNLRCDVPLWNGVLEQPINHNIHIVVTSYDTPFDTTPIVSHLVRLRAALDTFMPGSMMRLYETIMFIHVPVVRCGSGNGRPKRDKSK
jgi:hypothetical protein